DGIRDATVTGVQTCALPISGDVAGHRAGTGVARGVAVGGRGELPGNSRLPRRSRRAHRGLPGGCAGRGGGSHRTGRGQPLGLAPTGAAAADAGEYFPEICEGGLPPGGDGVSGTLAVYQKELSTYFRSPIAYYVVAVFLLGTGYFFLYNIFLTGDATMAETFQNMGVLLLTLIPVVSM